MNLASQEKGLKIFHLCLLLLIISIILTPVISAQDYKPVKLYLYNSVEIEREWPTFPHPTNYSLFGKLNTSSPDESKENYTYCPTDIENFTYSHGTIGHWFSEPLFYSINASINISADIWMKSQTNITNISLRPWISIPTSNGYHGYGLGIDDQNLSNYPKRFSFNNDFSNIENLRMEGRLKFALKWNFTPSKDPSSDNITLISFSEDMQSSFQLYLDSVRSKIASFFIDHSKKVIDIDTKVSDALGLSDIKEYSLSIIGPIANVTPNERIIDVNDYSINSSWSWDYGSVKAPSGNYTFVLTVIDNSNNKWEDTITVYIQIIEENEVNIFAYLVTPLFILIIILVIYYTRKLKKPKNK